MSSTPTDPDELRAEIAVTREELGETAAALAAKTDLTARLKHSVTGLGHNLTGRITGLFRRSSRGGE